MTDSAAGIGLDAGRRGRVGLIALVVGAVLADSSIVTLGLPAVSREFGAGVSAVAWVLVSFNLVLALAALPAAALVRRRGPGGAWRGGIVLFAAASLGCALAPNLEFLVAARCLQATGGAAVVAAALVLLAAERGRRDGARIWSAAGVVGAAFGPALGGALTEQFSWQAIFAVQVPLVLVAVGRLGASAADAVADERVGRPRLGPTAALALVSAALTAALFLLVILLTEGWRHSALEAAAIVSVMPLAALAVAPMARRLGSTAAGAAGGATLIAGGLLALGLLPKAQAWWTVAPQLLIGAGLGLALSALAARALRADGALLSDGAWVIAARHGGVVLGLLLLTPLFTADLQREQVAAERAGTARLLDAPLAPALKIDLAGALAKRISGAGGRLPELGPAFASIDPGTQDRAAYAKLRADLTDDVQSAATHAFSRSFMLAAFLALLALVPIAFIDRSLALIPATLVALLLSGGLAAAYIASGGGSYKPPDVEDPCKVRPWPRDVSGLPAVAEQLSLSALDGAACRLRVTREELALAIASSKGRSDFLREHAISDGVLQDALRKGLQRAIVEAQQGDALTPQQAQIARAVVGVLPIGTLIDAVRSGPGALNALRSLLGG